MISSPSPPGTNINIHLPAVRWEGTTLTFVVCALAVFVLWRWTAKWDHRVHIILGILIGVLLTVTNVGAWILVHIHAWTNGQLG